MAVEKDPSFASAQSSLSGVLVYSNRAQEAVVANQRAMDNLYRLPERLQFVVRANHYSLTQDIEKAYAVIDMWAELYPEDQLALAF